MCFFSKGAYGVGGLPAWYLWCLCSAVRSIDVCRRFAGGQGIDFGMLLPPVYKGLGAGLDSRIIWTIE